LTLNKIPHVQKKNSEENGMEAMQPS
jgi:hypothetical protein